MDKTDKYSLTEGGIVNKLFMIAAPLIVTQFFQMAYNLTDMFWLGRLSSGAVAASGTVGFFVWLSVAFLMFGRMGAEIGVSQNLGSGDRGKAQEYAENSILIGIYLGIALAIVFLLGRVPFIGFFGILDSGVEKDAIDYLAIVSFSFPMAFITSAITGIFNGAGNSRVSLIINGVGFALNMALDPLLIFTAGLGIRGAGVATVIAHSSAACLSLIVLNKYKNRPFERLRLIWRPNGAIIRQVVKWVLPISVEGFLFTLLTMPVAALVASFGTDAMAAMRVSSQVESLTWLIVGGYGSALIAFTGQNFGAGKWGRIQKGFKVSSALIVCWGAAVSLTLFFGGGALIELFIPNEPEVLKIGVEYLRILATIQIPMCLEGVAAGAFRGQGRTIPPSVASITSNALRVTLAFILARYTGLGLTGIWISVSLGAGLRGLWIYIWYLLYSKRTQKNR